ncbi:uncharacterized protein LOC134528388 isoform X1 [Bacillus rossius redtenbacheri]|uniref:uncharacterized protein LOC134528388 isoform X1 n=1 Tax=Bacillus rossius redtenbacheri TaxID=93214 RepID=UPI002FDEDEAC
MRRTGLAYERNRNTNDVCYATPQARWYVRCEFRHGINKHFHMACIIHTLQKNLNRKVSSSSVWKYLESLYNLPLLGDTEDAQFPVAEKIYTLPESCGAFLKKERAGASAAQANAEGPDLKVSNAKPKDAKVKPEESKEAHRAESGAKGARKSLVKGNIKKEQIKEEKKDVKKESKEKKHSVGADKPPKQESKENKEDRKESVTKKDPEEREAKGKEKPSKKEEGLQLKERQRDGDSPKRGVKRTRGSARGDDSSSTHSSSPVTTQTAQKRRRL